MTIREATIADTPEIISLLKASLGEENLPLSQEIWIYKHINNPFGKSLVLIAIENNCIAGVRAFMKWKWQMGHEEFSAVRAVDTATHPNFQGKGIFKKLTMEAVQISKGTGNNFVFNTPNENSRPGYLKMGWKISGKILVGIKPAWGSFFTLSSTNTNYTIQKEASTADLKILCKAWNLRLETGKKIFTPKSVNYLNWRYENNPLQQYQVYANKQVYIAGYVKNRSKIKELRIAECLSTDFQSNKILIERIIKDWEKKFGAHITTYSGNMKAYNKFLVNFRIGPLLTLRDLQIAPGKKTYVFNINNWAYSLGDLELY